LRTALGQAIDEGQALRALSLAAELEERSEELSDEELQSLLPLVDSIAPAELPSLPEGTLAAALVEMRQALVASHRGDNQGAQRHLSRAAHAERLHSQLERVRARLKLVKVDPRRIAVLLPMTGDHAAVGEELWAGMSLALPEESDAIVTVFDTGGTEAGARQAVAQALEAGSLLALGPAGRLESRAAARAAALAELPIALLAPESDAANAEAGVFRLALAPSFEAEQAAIVAVELGYSLLAVMTPRDELGAEQAKAFIAAARKAGAEVVAQGDYDPSAASLEEDFKNFLKLHPTVNKRLRRHLRAYGRKSWKSFTPTPGFDFLYMPDTVERGSLAASYLPFFNVELRTHDDMSIGRLRFKHAGRMPRIVQLMGSSSWIDPSLGARGGSAVEGALMIGTCPGGHGIDLSERGRSFGDEFTRLKRRAPSMAAAAANDAMTMILGARAWAASHGGTRADAARSLRTAQLRDGVCGTQTMNSRGQIEGEIEVLRVEQGSPEIYEY
jgi:ABC-type branched-subunit amino acid transport system substrate-binding protein